MDDEMRERLDQIDANIDALLNAVIDIRARVEDIRAHVTVINEDLATTRIDVRELMAEIRAGKRA